jgi:uncharacterized protein with von Willebrand factor type A (vWA) domain
MRVYILLDRSGSMGTQWSDTLGAINAYVKELNGDTNVYLAAFDSGYNGDLSYQELRNTTAKGFKPLSESESQPRGGTPLFDSMARLIEHAFEESPEKAYIVVLTDGEENTSRKFTKEVIREKLARVEDRNWEVVFLGANFDQVTAQAASVGLNMAKAYSIDTRNLSDEMKFMATNTTAYATSGARTEFTSTDRLRAKK